MRIYGYVLACTGLLYSPWTCADFDLARAQHYAYAQDPVLQHHAAQQQADQARVQQATQWENPVLSLDVDNFNPITQRLFNPTTLAVRVSQAVPRLDKMQSRMALAQLAQQRSTLQQQQRKAQINADIRLCLAAWSTAATRWQLSQDDAAVAADVARVLAAQWVAGRVVQSEQQRAAALARQAEQQVAHDAVLRDAQRGVCVQYMGELPVLPPVLSLVLPQTLPVNALLSVQQATSDAQNAQAQLQRTQAERRADVTVSAGLKRDPQLGGTLFLVGASLPLPFFDPNLAARRDAQVQRDVAQQQQKLTIQRSQQRQSALQNQIVSQQNMLNVLDATVLPATQERLRIAAAAYQAGKTGLLDWLDARRTWRDAREQRLLLWGDIQRNLADLERDQSSDSVDLNPALEISHFTQSMEPKP